MFIQINGQIPDKISFRYGCDIYMPKILRVIYPNTGRVNFGSGNGLIAAVAQSHHLIDDSIEMWRS